MTTNNYALAVAQAALNRAYASAKVVDGVMGQAVVVDEIDPAKIIAAVPRPEPVATVLDPGDGGVISYDDMLTIAALPAGTKLYTEQPAPAEPVNARGLDAAFLLLTNLQSYSGQQDLVDVYAADELKKAAIAAEQQQGVSNEAS